MGLAGTGTSFVLNDAEIRRAFRIIQTTRHASRNRLAFTLSLYAGLRVGEIATLKIGDVATTAGEIRRETKLSANQTKGSQGSTVVLSSRVRSELEAFLKERPPDAGAPLIHSQRNGRAFSSVTLSMLFKEILNLPESDVLSFRTTHLCNSPARSGCWDANHPEADGSQAHCDDDLYCDVSDEMLRNA